MRALKLVQHMNINAVRMSEGLLDKIRKSERCADLVRKVSLEAQKQANLETYRDLTNWLSDGTDSSMQDRYIARGILRAGQGVPFSNMYWAVCIAHEHLWEYMQEECLIEEPVEFWGGVMLLRSLTRFFERATYYTLIGYEKAASGTRDEVFPVLSQR
jgi:hypothetical protein